MTHPDRRLAADATGQRGAFTAAQARAAGMSARQLRSRVQSGSLERTGVRTYRSALTPPSALGELHSLVLDIGSPCWVSGPSAAALHRFDTFELHRPFHVLTLRDRNVRRLGAVVHTTIELPLLDRGEVDGLPVLSPTRTLVDLARHVDRERLTAALDGALRDRLTTEDFLHRRITALRRQGRYGIPMLLAAIEGRELSRGGHSWLERRFLELVGSAGLPRPVTQQVLGRAGDRLIRVDCRFPGTPVVVELLGYRWHSTPTQLARDTERLNALVLDGFVPLQFTYQQVVQRSAHVVATVAEALAPWH
jgi:hypothetical protein